MEIGGDKETDDSGDDAKKFDFVVGRDAAREVFGDLTIKNDDAAASDSDRDAGSHPTEAKFKIHILIIAHGGA